MPFDFLVDALISAFLALALFGIGLSATFGDMLGLLQDRTRLFPALAANVLCAPLVALLLVWLIPMEPAAATVLLLLAFLPGGINAVQFSTKAPGQLATAGELLIVLSVISLLVAPFAAQLLLEPEGPLSLPWDRLLLRVGAFVLVPLLLGMWIRARVPTWAEKLYKPAMLISTLCFIASVVISLGLRQDALGELGSGAALAMLAFVVLMMAVGWFLGGPDPDSRQVLAVSTNLRNVGLAYVLVEDCCDDPLLASAVLAYMAIMVTPNLLLTVGCGIARKRRLARAR
jgi:BASS family bile acid:Na+ symporter